MEGMYVRKVERDSEKNEWIVHLLSLKYLGGGWGRRTRGIELER